MFCRDHHLVRNAFHLVHGDAHGLHNQFPYLKKTVNRQYTQVASLAIMSLWEGQWSLLWYHNTIIHIAIFWNWWQCLYVPRPQQAQQQLAMPPTINHTWCAWHIVNIPHILIFILTQKSEVLTDSELMELYLWCNRVAFINATCKYNTTAVYIWKGWFSTF
jgi:hypothetical protein